jgi:hypothetical protein
MTEPRRYKYPAGTRPPHEVPQSATPIPLDRDGKVAARPTGQEGRNNPQEQTIYTRICEWCDERGYEHPERQFRFCKRLYRFDWAWPSRRLALEFEGGTFGNEGWHTGSGYAKDCRKYNLATALKWRVFRLSSLMYKEGELDGVLVLMFEGVSL